MLLLFLIHVSDAQNFVGDDDEAVHHLEAEGGHQEAADDVSWSDADVKPEVEPRKLLKRLALHL